jgi:hypothetical protein
MVNIRIKAIPFATVPNGKYHNPKRQMIMSALRAHEYPSAKLTATASAMKP